MYISKSNLKVSCPTWSIPSCGIAGYSSKCKACEGYCYAAKAERLYPQVIPSRLSNLVCTLGDEFESEIQEWLDRNKPSYFRVHESGDFYRVKYFEKWVQIALNNPNIIFYAYTKKFSLGLIARPANFVLNYSFDGIDNQDNYHKALKRFDNVAKTTSFNCNCPAILNPKEKICMKTCFKCAEKNGQYCILFRKH